VTRRALIFFLDRERGVIAAHGLADAGLDPLLVTSESACLEAVRYARWHLCLVDDPKAARALSRRLRAEEIDVPVLVTVAKIFARASLTSLRRRALAAAPRSQHHQRGLPLCVADLTIDPSAFGAFRAGVLVELTRREFQILYLLALAGAEPLSVSQLALRCGIEHSSNLRKAVTVQIVRLRQKLRAAGSDAEITNVRGRGWSLS
jgi:hypothetical protein